MSTALRRISATAGALLLFGFVCSPGCGGGSGNGGGDAGLHSDTGPVCTFFPDNCPAGENCYTDISKAGKLRVCQPFNADKSVGDACAESAVNDCGDGLRCVDQTCLEICHPDGGEMFGCDSSHLCIPLSSHGYNLEWGVCDPKTAKCKRWPADDCGSGQNCYQLPQGTRCLDYDSDAEVGDVCKEPTDCNADQVCLNNVSEEKDYCRAKCDDKHACENGSCYELPDEPYGACVADQGN